MRHKQFCYCLASSFYYKYHLRLKKKICFHSTTRGIFFFCYFVILRICSFLRYLLTKKSYYPFFVFQCLQILMTDFENISKTNFIYNSQKKTKTIDSPVAVFVVLTNNALHVTKLSTNPQPKFLQRPAVPFLILTTKFEKIFRSDLQYTKKR